MKKLDLGQTVGILANIGVIAGIVFLGLELRQNNELLETEARQGLMQNRLDANRAWAADENMMQLRLKAHDGEQLTQVDQWRLEADFAGLVAAIEWEYEQFQSGRVSYIPIDGWRAVLNRWSYFQSMWLKTRNRFSPEFARFMDEELLNQREATH